MADWKQFNLKGVEEGINDDDDNNEDDDEEDDDEDDVVVVKSLSFVGSSKGLEYPYHSTLSIPELFIPPH